MKKWFYLTALLVFPVVFSSCIKDLEQEGFFETTHCLGTVLDQRTQQPLLHIRVMVTDGSKTSTVVYTTTDGTFDIPVTVDEVGKGYYLHLDADSLYEPRDVTFKDMTLGVETYNVGTIYLVGPELPVVATDTTADITASTAHCVGQVLDAGKSTVTERGFVYSTMQYPTVNDHKVEFGTGLGSFEGTLEGLSFNTTYYVRAYARNGVGVGYGRQLVFTTLDGLPTVSTDAVESITPITAVCGGEVLADGGFAVTSRGVCWSISMQPTLSNAHSTDGNGLGTFVSHLSNLEPGKTYYVRAYAQNTAGVSYGEQVSFTTPSGLPEVTTGTVTNITATTAVCGGTVTTDGGFSVTARGVCFSTTPNPVLAGPHTTDGAGLGTFVSQLTNLTSHTTYYVRAYATNGTGTIYGEERMFVTE